MERDLVVDHLDALAEAAGTVGRLAAQGQGDELEDDAVHLEQTLHDQRDPRAVHHGRGLLGAGRLRGALLRQLGLELIRLLER
eukprot:14810221-Heterocapsa_arctica.AAC.1